MACSFSFTNNYSIEKSDHLCSIVTANLSSGKEVMIPINKPWIEEEERREVLNVLEENALTDASTQWRKKSTRF